MMEEKKTEATVVLEGELCKECLLCIEVCVPDVLKVSDKLNKMGYHPDVYIDEFQAYTLTEKNNFWGFHYCLE